MWMGYITGLPKQTIVCRGGILTKKYMRIIKTSFVEFNTKKKITLVLSLPVRFFRVDNVLE